MNRLRRESFEEDEITNIGEDDQGIAQKGLDDFLAD